MGKIMYMGEAYTASPLPNAGSIEYDNSTSHLTATTMQGAVDELNGKLAATWGTCQLDTTNTSGGAVEWSRTGNVVTVGGYVKPSNSTSHVKILTLPYKPVSGGNPIAQHDASPYCIYLGMVVGGLDITVGPHSSGNYIRFLFSYITSD